jgi:RNA polymerase sigma-70 factor (ECF subfamily)
MSARDAAPELFEEPSPGRASGLEPAGGEQRPPSRPEPEDTELVLRARAGDRAAFRLLVERHQRRLYRLALGIVKDHEEALDVVQEALVKVHHHLATFKGEAAFGTWAYRITYNLSIDALRRHKGEKVEVDDRTLTDEAEQHEEYGGGSPSPQKSALRGELAEELQRGLSQLSEAHRTILLLREVDGLSYEELSVTLKIPKGTVMSRLFHARHKMQAALRGYLAAGAEPGESATPAPATPAQAGGRRGR